MTLYFKKTFHSKLHKNKTTRIYANQCCICVHIIICLHQSLNMCIWKWWWWCRCMFLCACVWYIICLCVSRHWGGHKICRIITRKRLGRRWKASYWFLKGPDSSPECFISSALFVLHIKDSIFLWILIAVKAADPLLLRGGQAVC